MISLLVTVPPCLEGGHEHQHQHHPHSYIIFILPHSICKYSQTIPFVFLIRYKSSFSSCNVHRYFPLSSFYFPQKIILFLTLQYTSVIYILILI